MLVFSDELRQTSGAHGVDSRQSRQTGNLNWQRTPTQPGDNSGIWVVGDPLEDVVLFVIDGGLFSFVGVVEDGFKELVVEGGVCFHVFERWEAPPKIFEHFSILSQTSQTSGQVCCRPSFEMKARFAMLDELTHAANVRTNDWNSGSKRFMDNEG